LAVINDLKLFFSIPQVTLPWQPISLAKSISFPHLLVRMTFARAAPPTYDKKGIAMQGAGKQITYRAVD